MPQIDELKAAFSESLGVRQDVDFEGLAYGQTPGWDSVAHMTLVAAIESKFDVLLATDEVIALSNFQEAKNILAKHGLNLS